MKGFIDPSLYVVAPIPEAEARAFIERHHYSGSYPAARARYGIHELRGGCTWAFGARLVGVVVFSVPIQPNALRRWCGVAPEHGVELGRLAILDDAGRNAASFLISRALRLLSRDKPDVRAVLSYADPTPRRAADGALVKRGHIGTAYQAANARYMGRSSVRTVIMTDAGTVISGRTLSKIRAGARGWRAHARQFVQAGAPEPRVGESGREYVRRAIDEGPFIVQRHEGKHVYGWPVGRRKHETVRGFAPAQNYPKK